MIVNDPNQSSGQCLVSGVPQRSVLARILFIICMIDSEDGIGSNILTFANDMHIFRRTESQEHRQNPLVCLNNSVILPEK